MLFSVDVCAESEHSEILPFYITDIAGVVKLLGVKLFIHLSLWSIHYMHSIFQIYTVLYVFCYRKFIDSAFLQLQFLAHFLTLKL